MDVTAQRSPAETATGSGPLRALRSAFSRIPAPSRRTMRRFAVASLVANIGIVVTGSAVRLTGSGLGCPTWPRCTDESYVVHGDLGLHGAVEFGNRLLTFAVAAVAIATWVAAMRYQPARSSLRWLATVLALGVPAQALIGGMTVLTDLNPWIVALHLLVSMAMIAAAVVLIRRVDESDRPPRATVPRPVVLLGRLTLVVAWVVLYLGTVVTGSGPHAGDEDSPRTGLDPGAMSQLHADFVFLLLGLSIALLLALRAVGAPERAVRAAAWLVGVELAQGLVGFVQYFSDLPILLVGLHVLGAALVSATATWVQLGLRDRGAAALVERKDATS
ncbi:MAG: COX15/CtaA family protein [Nocardioidaceae bacterium]